MLTSVMTFSLYHGIVLKNTTGINKFLQNCSLFNKTDLCSTYEELQSKISKRNILFDLFLGFFLLFFLQKFTQLSKYKK